MPLLELDDGERLAGGRPSSSTSPTRRRRRLAPATGTLARYRLAEWLNFIASELYRNYTPLFDEAMPEAAKAIHRRTLSARYAWVESQLAGKDYLMGSDFTVADAACSSSRAGPASSTWTSVRATTSGP